ncbi:MAG: hypothetical protein H0U76_03985 [Ktedonobacteraceae bacterium]|nr:hypothetical protein [Ktedonobacteraceae bacterium]
MPKKQEIPTTFQEGKNYSFDIFDERPSRQESGAIVWWHMGGSSTIRSMIDSIKYEPDGHLVKIVAMYRRGKTEASIGEGLYRKRGPYGHVETLETLEAHGAMTGLVEDALVGLEDERRAAEEAARTYPCDYPGCYADVPGTLGPAYRITIQVGDYSQTVAFYGCEGSHYEALKSPEKLSVTLQIPQRAASPTGRIISDARLIALVEQTYDR